MEYSQEPVWLVVLVFVGFAVAGILQYRRERHPDPWVRYRASPWAPKPRTPDTRPRKRR
jgi:hypothetical protein